MKHCKIEKYVQPYRNSIYTNDKYFHVNLNDNVTISFRSEKETLLFLSNLRREIDSLIITSNCSLIEIYKYYRTAWFYTNNIYFTEFKEIEENLNKIMKYQHSPNANHFILKNLRSLLENMISIIDLIFEVLKNNKMYLDCRILKSIKKRLLNEFNSLFNVLHENNKIVQSKALF